MENMILEKAFLELDEHDAQYDMTCGRKRVPAGSPEGITSDMLTATCRDYRADYGREVMAAEGCSILMALIDLQEVTHG